MPVFHLVTGEYPPGAGGVGDYTERLVAPLALRGSDIHVWSPAIRSDARGKHASLHALPDVFGRGSRAMLERALRETPGILLLQYVPNALGRRGVNIGFCSWLLRMRRSGADVRVMFHEPYFYFSLTRPLHNVLAVAQRIMAALLLRASSVAYLSTETWIRYLRPYAAARTSFVPLPIPATINGAPIAADLVHTWRQYAAGSPIVGHFGTYGRDVREVLEPASLAILDGDPRLQMLFVGRRSDEFASDFASRCPRVRDRVHATGELGCEDVAAALAACDLLLQPYPDGVTTRRTSVMAGLSHGVATVTTTGALTERIWVETGAAALAPAGDVSALRDVVLRLLADDQARQAQGVRGKRVYDERFSIEHTVDVLTGRTPSAAPVS